MMNCCARRMSQRIAANVAVGFDNIDLLGVPEALTWCSPRCRYAGSVGRDDGGFCVDADDGGGAADW